MRFDYSYQTYSFSRYKVIMFLWISEKQVEIYRKLIKFANNCDEMMRSSHTVILSTNQVKNWRHQTQHSNMFEPFFTRYTFLLMLNNLFTFFISYPYRTFLIKRLLINNTKKNSKKIESNKYIKKPKQVKCNALFLHIYHKNSSHKC